MAKTQKNKMLIVMVGTDERPAGDVDAVCFSEIDRGVLSDGIIIV